MKTYVLLPLWLLLSLSLQAQTPPATAGGRPQPCSTCCNASDEPGLILILAPELAAQCRTCILVSVAQCPLSQDDLAAQRSRLRYTIRIPDGTIVSSITPMTLTPDGWEVQLYPVGDPAPACDSSPL